MKVVINYQEFPDVETEKSILRGAFPSVEIVESRTLDATEFITEAEGAQALLVAHVAINKHVIDATPQCLGYVRYGAGYDNIDAEYALEQGKIVARVPRFCIDEVSNHALAMLLALNRKLVSAHQLLVQGNYQFEKIMPVTRLKDSTVGIVGVGNIGGAFADRIVPLVKQVLMYDPYVEGYPGCQKVDDLRELCRASDYTSLHVPLTSRTRRLIDREMLEVMKPTAYLINTSRGPVVDEEALVAALHEGRLGGAGLDVFETEPLPADSPLRQLDNVILTHHSAFYSEGSLLELKETAARQVVQILEGRRPDHELTETWEQRYRREP